MNGVALCAGIGGLELGLRITLGDYRTVCYVEREVYCASVIVARMAEQALCEAPVWDDISTFDGRPWRGVVDIITSGDPCQPFSVAGQRQGKSDERYLWSHVERVIREVEPRFVFLENVGGAVDIRYEHKAVLESMGYRVEAGLFSAEEVGAPHQRVRVFLLAHKQGTDGNTRVERQQMPIGGYGGELDKPENDTAIDNGILLGVSTLALGIEVGESSGRESHRRPGGCGFESHTPRPPMAHSESRCESSGSEPAGFRRGDTVAEPGGELDKSLSSRHIYGQPQEQPAIGGLKAQCQSEPGNGELGNSARQGLEILERDGQASPPTAWPPGPSDLDSWRRILAEHPEVEPAVCRVANGFAFRVERLSCLGNAVVPVVAALAFTTLWGRLNNDTTVQVGTIGEE